MLLIAIVLSLLRQSGAQLRVSIRGYPPPKPWLLVPAQLVSRKLAIVLDLLSAVAGDHGCGVLLLAAKVLSVAFAKAREGLKRGCLLLA